MDFQQLTYFTKIAELQNITKAAAELFISQPALSKSLQNLESELDVQFFLRKGKNIYLTKEGSVFYEQAKKVLRSVADTKTVIEDLRICKQLPIRLKVRALGGLIPQMIAGFNQRYPEITLSIDTGGSFSFSTFDYDLIIASKNVEQLCTQQKNSMHLCQEEICLAVSKDSPFASLSACRIEDLKQMPLIYPTKSRTLREALDTYLEESSFIPAPFIDCNDPNIIADLIRKGCGVSLLPQYSFSESILSGIRLIPLMPSLKRDIILS